MCRQAQAEAERRLREDLEWQVARLQQDKEDFKRSNAALLKKPFGFSSEKRPPDKDAPRCPGGGPLAASGGDAEGAPQQRKRSGQPGAAPNPGRTWRPSCTGPWKATSGSVRKR